VQTPGIVVLGRSTSGLVLCTDIHESYEQLSIRFLRDVNISIPKFLLVTCIQSGKPHRYTYTKIIIYVWTGISVSIGSDEDIARSDKLWPEYFHVDYRRM